MEPDDAASSGNLAGVRVELADEQAEYVAGPCRPGAEVKIEPPGGSPTRRIGPFVDDIEHPEPIAVLLALQPGQAVGGARPRTRGPSGRASGCSGCSRDADVFLESTPRMARIVGDHTPRLHDRFPGLIVARMSPFGDDGPWAGFKARISCISHSAGR